MATRRKHCDYPMRREHDAADAPIWACAVCTHTIPRWIRGTTPRHRIRGDLDPRRATTPAQGSAWGMRIISRTLEEAPADA